MCACPKRRSKESPLCLLIEMPPARVITERSPRRLWAAYVETELLKAIRLCGKRYSVPTSRSKDNGSKPDENTMPTDSVPGNSLSASESGSSGPDDSTRSTPHRPASSAEIVTSTAASVPAQARVTRTKSDLEQRVRRGADEFDFSVLIGGISSPNTSSSQTAQSGEPASSAHPGNDPPQRRGAVPPGSSQTDRDGMRSESSKVRQNGRSWLPGQSHTLAMAAMSIVVLGLAIKIARLATRPARSSV